MDRKSGFSGREKRVSGESGPVQKRGDGLHLGGPVGKEDGYRERPSSPQTGGDRNLLNAVMGGAGKAAGGGLLKKILPIILIAVVVLGGGGGLTQLLGGVLGGSTGVGESHGLLDSLLAGGGTSDSGGFSVGGGGYESILGSLGAATNSVEAAGPVSQGGSVNTKVAPGARPKRVVPLGGGQDVVTILVYMCGTDLESKYGMATSDMQEMTKATIGSNVNLLVYTGGCTQWKNSVVSNQTNQIYQVRDGGLIPLEENLGSKSMTDPATLASYIQWGAKRFPANRTMLILWDHGGGSTGGYGHDELFPQTGSMGLDKIDKALEEGGQTFDFIGFDACLMATLENASMLSKYADYLIASEETEPGIGWYYTNWLTALSQNTSMDTLSIGQRIVDDFTAMCAQKTPRDQTTLSVIDLAEVESIVSGSLTEFAKSTGELIRTEQYSQVSTARGKTKEFARSIGIDQVDLIHLAENMNTSAGQKLAADLKSCVKYNRFSSSVGTAYGISIYFPYGKLSSMDKMVDTYEKIGMDSEYTQCIKSFASLEAGGQAAGGGVSGSVNSLFSLLSGGSSSSGQGGGGSMLDQLLQGQGLGNIQALLGGGRFVDNGLLESKKSFLESNQIAPEALVWKEKNGIPVLELPEKQWDIIQTVELNVFLDDGTGYLDLGLDGVYSFTQEGDLQGTYDGTWLAINGQPVAYYMLSAEETANSYHITGRVPAMLNDQLVDLILVFTGEEPNGVVAGARIRYQKGTVETQAKGLIVLQPGDRLDFLCDYYSYDQAYLDSYYLGDPLVVEDGLEITNVALTQNSLIASYRLTDTYQNHFWTQAMN